MLIEKALTNFHGRIINASRYVCDMCRKPMAKQDRILISKSNKGEDISRKKWDLCESCMKTIEKNVNLWYDRIVNKKQ